MAAINRAACYLPDEMACPWKEGGWMPGDQPAGVLC